MEHQYGVYTTDGPVGIIKIDSPPVNALGFNTRTALDEGFRKFAADDSIKAIVLICAGRTFFAGADISEFGKPPRGPALAEVFSIIENGPKPVVAAIHGTALGGGLELALICHYRVAVPSARFGLPEVNLGLLPGAGGTQRLPRLVGIESALDIMTSGRQMDSKEALSTGVIDGIAEEGKLQDYAIDFAKDLIAQNKPLQRVRDRDDKVLPARGKPEIFDAFRKANARSFRGFKAPENIIKAIEASAELPFDQGLLRERELFNELVTSPHSAAQRYMFFAEREAAKIPDIPADTPTIPVKKIGVIGAGTMGGGIAMNFLNAGIPVTIVEMAEANLERGVGVIRANYERSAKNGRFTMDVVEQRMAMLTPSLKLEDLADVDLIIEAVFESMDVKKDVFGKLDKIAKQGAILASNTSFLDVDEIASATSRPEWVVGMHFFSPANVMRLLEVVRGAKTAPAVINTAMKMGKTIGKVTILSRVCNGFIANRLMTPRGREANAILLQGVPAQDIDRVVYDYGFGVGPFQMSDIVGLDVLGRDSTERTLSGDMVKAGRLGQKNGKGYYDYDANRKGTPSADSAKIIADFAAFKGVAQTGPKTDEEIIYRLLFPVVNEGAKILGEGIAIRASDVDCAAVFGYNWPLFTGGPMHWASAIGLDTVVAKLKEYGAETGDPIYTPAPLLEKLAAEGKGF